MRGIVPVIVILLLLTACSSIDCVLNNTVYSKYVVSSPTGVVSDTLFVHTTKKTGKDTLLLNRKVNVKDFLIQMSYDQPTDILIMEFKDTFGVSLYDTVKVSKQDICHFESVDCPPVFFHTINGVEHTRNVIDSIIISKSIVNHDTTAGNFKIYIKPGH